MKEESHRYIFYLIAIMLVFVAGYLQGRRKQSTGEDLHSDGDGPERVRQEILNSRKLNDENTSRIEDSQATVARVQDGINAAESAVDRSQDDLHRGIQAVREGRTLIERIRANREKNKK